VRNLIEKLRLVFRRLVAMSREVEQTRTECRRKFKVKVDVWPF